MRLLSAFALTVAAVLATAFWSCDSNNGPVVGPFDGGATPHNPNDALNPPGDVFLPTDSVFFPDASFADAQQTGFPDSSF
jgi:hypothetical protein